MEDIRWQQRLINFRKALSQLEKAVSMASHTDIEREGLIQRFEYTYELAWNLMKDFLEEKGNTDIQGSKDAIRLAFSNGLISDGESWMEMVKSRRLSSHTYNENTARQIAEDVIHVYFSLFIAFLERMDLETGKNV